MKRVSSGQVPGHRVTDIDRGDECHAQTTYSRPSGIRSILKREVHIGHSHMEQVSCLPASHRLHEAQQRGIEREFLFKCPDSSTRGIPFPSTEVFVRSIRNRQQQHQDDDHNLDDRDVAQHFEITDKQRESA